MLRLRSIGVPVLALAMFSNSLLTARSISAPQQSGGSSPTCPAQPVTDVTNPDPPSDACVPGASQDTAFFDDFSWRMFVALMWPAASGARGVPDRSARLDATTGARVFETYKAEWEVFSGNPSDWDQYDQYTPCGLRPDNSALILASNSKMGSLGQGGVGDLVNALPSRSGKWVLYQTAFNKVTYQQMKAEKLYDAPTLASRKKSGPPIQIDVGGINVKAAWVEIPDSLERQKYYTRDAIVFDPVLDRCREAMVSLVGMHIVTQTERSTPYWIWSTFEHVDNVPVATQLPMGFNNGNGEGLPKKDPNGGFPPKSWASPVLYNVERTNLITPSTVSTNHNYQVALPGVWQNYRLVMTHWPLDRDPSHLTTPQRMTPTPGSANIAANPVLETFLPKSTCMLCHSVAEKTNFIWALETHVNAGAATTESTESTKTFTVTPAIKELRRILEEEIKRPRRPPSR